MKAGLLVLVSVWGTAAVAEAQPFGTRLTLDGDPTTTMAVAWNSTDTTDDRIHFGTTPGTLDRMVVADETHDLPAPLGRVFVAHLTGLTPATEYWYQVGNGTRWHPSGSAFHFRTFSADRCAGFTAIVIGDNRADTDGVGPSPLWSEIMVEAMAFSPSLFVNTGDMVKNGNNPVEWEAFLRESEPGFANTPSLVTMGNHDEDDVSGEGALYNQIWALPRNSRTDLEDYYSIDVGPIHFVSLNTQYTRPSTTEMSDMATWLRGDLAAATLPWRIVFFHKAVYTRGNHHTGEENGGAINAMFVPVFDEHDVDFVFNGHSHDYERFAPSVGLDREFGGSGRSFPVGDGGAIRGRADALPDGTMGTHYVVTGGAGALTTDVFGFTCIDAACTYCTGFNTRCPDEVYENDVDGTVMYDGRHNFVVLQVMGDQITGEVRATVAGNSRGGGEEIDSFAVANGSFPMELCGGGPMPAVDAGPPIPGVDTGPAPRIDAGPRPPGGGSGSDEGGCGCRVVTGSRGRGVALGAMLLAVALAVLSWRRR